MDGMWSYQPGFGYGWVSSYPWGWTPYHYGNWVYVPGFGWVWQPGGAWQGFSNMPRVLNAPQTFRPPQPPSNPRPGVVVVGRGLLPTGSTSKQLTIANNSAGLGIPRGGVKNLAKLNIEAKQGGFATASVHSAPVRPASTMSAGSMNGGTSSMHGSAPQRGGSSHASAPPTSGHASSAPHAGTHR
jgi:hypothetical protein